MPAATSDGTLEEPADLDARSGLFGIVTRPEGPCRDTAFIIISSGLLHRVGPFRLYVDIARRIAAAGFASVRLDQSGKGDSDARAGVSLAEATVADVSAAAAHLKREFGTTGFVVGGVCSGADDALQAAPEISALRGLLMFDGYAPRTMRYYVNRYGPKLLSAKAWRKRMRLNPVKRTAARDIGSLRNWSSRPDMIGRYRFLLEEDVKLLAVYTSGASHSYNYASQLGAALGHRSSRRLLTEHYYPEATHLFPVTEHRRRVVNAVVAWAEQCFGGANGTEEEHSVVAGL